jgi:predicted phosphodiesterase
MAIKTFLAFSCVHCPHHDPDGIDWLVGQIKDRQPDVLVNLGDAFDTACLSSFAKANELSLGHEYDATEEVMSRIIDASPKAKRIWMRGNHEDRMFRPDYEALSRVLDYRRNLDCAKAFRHFDYTYDYRNVFRLGQVTFGHGWHPGVAACKREAIQLGTPNGLHIYGHTHRPHNVHRIAMGTTKLPYWHANPGTFIKPKPSYMKTKDDSLWGRGIVVGHANTKRIYDARHGWDAELVLDRMHWSEDGDHVDGGKVVA